MQLVVRPPASSHRLHFFRLDKRIQFLLLDHRDAIRLWRLIGLVGGIGVHLIGNRLMHHAQVTRNPPQVHPIGIQSQRLLPYVVRIAL